MDGSCPKCNSEKVGDSCSKCGLVFAKFDASILDEGVPDEVKALWNSVEEDWENEALHAVFIEKSLIAGAGGFVASSYRRRGDDDGIAVEQLKKITKRLETMMSEAASPRTATKGNTRVLGTIAFLVVLMVLALILVLFFRPGKI